MHGQTFRCRHCKQLAARRSEDQRYCGREACQRARKNAWRREKYSTDPDYRANHKESMASWFESQGGTARYYRRYRKRRKARRTLLGDDEPLADGRRQSAAAAQVGARSTGANSDAKATDRAVISGRYMLVACEGANSDAILVQLSLIPEG